MFLWAKRRVFPSDLESIAYAITDILMNPGICLWLLHVHIPNVGAEWDRAVENGDRKDPFFSLSQLYLVITMARVAIWYNNGA